MNATTKVILLASVTAAIGAVVEVLVTNKLDGDSLKTDKTAQSVVSSNSGSQWNNLQGIDAFQTTPQLTTYAGPGRQRSSANFNGAIWCQKFAKGGNPNAGVNGDVEQSWAFQTATKNPFANGTNCTYARAVLSATQDPTNQATSLVLGQGIAPNNPAE